MYSELCRVWVVSLTLTKQEKISLTLTRLIKSISLTLTKQEKISLTSTRIIYKTYRILFKFIINLSLL